MIQEAYAVIDDLKLRQARLLRARKYLTGGAVLLLEVEILRIQDQLFAVLDSIQ